MPSDKRPSNFVTDIIDADLASGKHTEVVTRFPPEPNGYLHIGHAKSIYLNFGLAQDYQGRCHLRFDNTNPEKEDVEYAESIQNDIRWLGFDWNEHLYFASDYFDKLYDFAIQLIQMGKAYVCSLSGDEVREYRGSLSEAGRHSPYRDRSVEENLDLFGRMRAGEFEDGAHVLRAKIDMANPNMKMRDPPLYRIRHVDHWRQGDKWCIYPLYDFTHGLSDYLENISHSICTLEFENNRELYDWFLDELGLTNRPHQYEFARLNLNYTVMSKRKLLELVRDGHVSGWDDPRMPTIAGLRRRGIPPEAIRTFCDKVGVAKNNSVVDVALLEHTIRDELNTRSPRVLAVLRPLRVVLENYPEDQSEELDAPYWPHDVPKEGSRPLPFSRVLYIEADDFAEDPPDGFKRLVPGGEVRLRHAYFIRCSEVIKDDAGNIVELRCTYDPDTRGGKSSDGRKVKGTIHWVSADHALDAEIRVYDRLFGVENPNTGDTDFKDHLNPNSLTAMQGCKIEPSVATATTGDRFQFERQGYFCLDTDATPNALVFNRVVALRDSWAKTTDKTAPKAVAPAATAPTERERPAKKPKTEVPETAEAIALREAHGLTSDDARVLTQDATRQAFFLAALSVHNDAQAIANWMVNEVLGRVDDISDLPFTGEKLGELVALVDDDTITSTGGKAVLADMMTSGDAPADIVDRKGLRQVTDSSVLEGQVAEVLANHPDEVARYQAGAKNLVGFFMGKVMRATGGKANAQTVQEILRKLLS